MLIGFQRRLRLKRLGVIIVLVGSVGMVTLTAQRIFTNPRPEPYFKTLFPKAAAFSPLERHAAPLQGLRRRPQDQSQRRRPIGFIFWTTDVVPREYGYHGPIHLLVGMDMTGIITGVVMDYNSEPYGYFSVDPPKFVEQFKGKSVRDPFAWARTSPPSRARRSASASATRAIRDSARRWRETFLTPESVKP